jgi:hypothetical protein
MGKLIPLSREGKIEAKALLGFCFLLEFLSHRGQAKLWILLRKLFKL